MSGRVESGGGMGEREALLAAIAAEPEEGTPRLAYADWLDENGGPERAEFIRVQCELARHLGQYSFPVVEVAALRRRRDELFLRLRPNLDVAFADGADPFYGIKSLTLSPDGWDNGTWRDDIPGGFVWRGFLEAVRMPAADWLEHGDAVRRLHPVRRVRLTTRPGVECEEREDGNYFRLSGGGPWFATAELVAEHRRQWEARGAFLPFVDRELLLFLRWPGVEFELLPE